MPMNLFPIKRYLCNPFVCSLVKETPALQAAQSQYGAPPRGQQQYPPPGRQQQLLPPDRDGSKASWDTGRR